MYAGERLPELRNKQATLQVRTAAWHQNDQLLLTAYIDQPGIRHAAAMAVIQSPRLLCLLNYAILK